MNSTPKEGVNANADGTSVPRSIIVRTSKVTAALVELVGDLRNLMSPNTGNSIKERSYNRMKDYIDIAGPLGVSHILGISQSESNVNLRLVRVPTGPTIHFRVLEYSLSRLVRNSQKKPYETSKIYQHAPLVVLNGFGASEQAHVKLMRAAFQNMFPTINVDTVKLNECRRVVLFHVNKADETVELRHYAIKATPVGISKNVKKLITSGKELPNLGDLEDVSEFITGPSGAVSDSEAEDEAARVELSDRYKGRGNIKAQKCSMKLIELGPRLKLEVFKVERGVCEGDILYHKFESKTEEEAAALKKKAETAKALKIQRKAQQDANVKRKKEEQAEKLRLKKERREEREKKRAESGEQAADGHSSSEEEPEAEEDVEEEQEDVEDEDEDDIDPYEEDYDYKYADDHKQIESRSGRRKRTQHREGDEDDNNDEAKDHQRRNDRNDRKRKANDRQSSNDRQHGSNKKNKRFDNNNRNSGNGRRFKHGK